MAEMINKLTFYAQIVLYVLVICCVVGGICWLYYTKVMKKKRIKEDEVDYSHLEREDTADYIKIEDIKDGMVIVDNGRRFVGAVKCQATRDFYAAQAAEQAAVAQNFFSFIGTIDGPVTYRQYCQAVDLEDTINLYKEKLAEREKELYNAVEDRKEILRNLNKSQSLTREEVSEYNLALEKIDRLIESLKIRKFHIEDQIGYMQYTSGSGVEPMQVQTWLFEWVYDPLDFSIDLSEEEIYKRALQELRSKASAIEHSLGNCGVKVTRCTTEELIEMSRRYSCPVSADRFKLRDIVNSSFFDDVNTSDCIDEMVKDAAKINAEMAADSFFDSIVDNLVSEEKKRMEGAVNEEAANAKGKQNNAGEGSASANTHNKGKKTIVKRKPVVRREKTVKRETAAEEDVAFLD